MKDYLDNLIETSLVFQIFVGTCITAAFFCMVLMLFASISGFGVSPRPDDWKQRDYREDWDKEP